MCVCVCVSLSLETPEKIEIFLRNPVIIIHSCPLQKIVLSAALRSSSMVVLKKHQLAAQAVTVTWLRARNATSAIFWSRVSFLIVWAVERR